MPISGRKPSELRRIWLADFGMQRVSVNFSLGTLTNREIREFRERASRILASKTDMLVVSSLCTKCTKSMLNNAPVKRINMNVFKKGFDIY